MELLLEILRATAALAAGAAIGVLFGHLQEVALRRNEERARAGQLASGWSLMPGAGARVAYLLLTLLAVQFVCPMLFADGTQWWVSGGLLLGFGRVLLQRLRRRRAGLS